MRSIKGVVTIVQEGRFQLVDDDGRAHHFLLTHKSPAEPEQLASLLQRRVLIRYSDPAGVLAHGARTVALLGEA